MDITVNRLPAPTWKRLRLNEALIQGAAFQGQAAAAAPVSVGLGPGGELSPLAGGMGSQLDQLFAQQGGEELRLRTVAQEARLRLDYSYQGAEAAALAITVEAGHSLDLTLIYRDGAQAPAPGSYAGARLRLKAQAGSRVRLRQLQLLGRGSTFLNDVGIELAPGADCQIYQLELGAGRVYGGTKALLAGEGSSFAYRLCYLAKAQQQLDFNVVAEHMGRKTVSNIIADGSLDRGSSKTFRGTIDFKQGAAGSVGEEQEAVLLLDDGAVNRSVPLILCSEEDVVGNHGASIGRLDRDLLFYLGSRGIEEGEASALLSEAKLAAFLQAAGPAAADLDLGPQGGDGEALCLLEKIVQGACPLEGSCHRQEQAANARED